MAAVMKFDTLAWAKKLEKVGVPSEQAEVQVELIFKAIDDNTCTKNDLNNLENNIKIKLFEQASRYAHEKFWPSCPQN